MANGETELKHLLTATLRLLPEHCKLEGLPCSGLRVGCFMVYIVYV